MTLRLTLFSLQHAVNILIKAPFRNTPFHCCFCQLDDVFTCGMHAKGVYLLVLYPSAAVPQIKVRKNVCCRGNQPISWFPTAG